VLALYAPGVDWTKQPCPLSGLADDVTATILHYMYAECLPAGLAEETAKECVKVASKLDGFSSFVLLCDTFLTNTALRHRKLTHSEHMYFPLTISAVEIQYQEAVSFKV
jgi:hypothetical protein